MGFTKFPPEITVQLGTVSWICVCTVFLLSKSSRVLHFMTGEEAAFLFFCLFVSRSHVLKDRICSLSKFFPLRVDPYFKEIHHSEKQTISSCMLIQNSR